MLQPTEITDTVEQTHTSSETINQLITCMHKVFVERKQGYCANCTHNEDTYHTCKNYVECIIEPYWIFP